jgi:site-specific DNA-methyltransferase (adenine-specific)
MEPIILRNGRDFAIQGIVLDVIHDINTLTTPKITKEELKQVDKPPSSKPYFEADNVLIYNEDFLKITAIPNNSIDLIVTSPPYNVDIHYNSHSDNLTYGEYLEFTRKWIKKCFDLTKSSGRFLLNIPLDKNKGGQQSVGADITRIAKDVGWKYHSTIIWNEGNISRRTAWGSYMSASAPYVIAPVELILVLYKDSWKKIGGTRKNDITKKEFMDWTNGVWTFNGQNKKGAGGHPAPFPIELPRRCIKLFSFIGDTVLDPFLGSGSTLIASYLHGRKGIGVEIDKKYCEIAINRLRQEAKIGQGNLLK